MAQTPENKTNTRWMKCPHCGSDCEKRVTDSRLSLRSNSVRRRRKCTGCMKRFTTAEMVVAVDGDKRKPKVYRSTMAMRGAARETDRSARCVEDLKGCFCVPPAMAGKFMEM